MKHSIILSLIFTASVLAFTIVVNVSTSYNEVEALRECRTMCGGSPHIYQGANEKCTCVATKK